MRKVQSALLEKQFDRNDQNPSHERSDGNLQSNRWLNKQLIHCLTSVKELSITLWAEVTKVKFNVLLHWSTNYLSLPHSRFCRFVSDISNARTWLLAEKSLRNSHLYNSLFLSQYSWCRNLLQLGKGVIFLLFLSWRSWSTEFIFANKVNVL